MNIREIKDLINLMNENQLTEIEVENEGSKIKLRKGGEIAVEHFRAPALSFATALPGQDAPSPANEPPASKAQTIKAPMVGTFYSAPAPDADPYVIIGAKVAVGQVICIIEAMKLMNEIKSEIKGVITEIHVQNGDPVEFGQVLFSVDKT